MQSIQALTSILCAGASEDDQACQRMPPVLACASDDVRSPPGVSGRRARRSARPSSWQRRRAACLRQAQALQNASGALLCLTAYRRTLHVTLYRRKRPYTSIICADEQAEEAHRRLAPGTGSAECIRCPAARPIQYSLLDSVHVVHNQVYDAHMSAYGRMIEPGYRHYRAAELWSTATAFHPDGQVFSILRPA